jgi:response regulator RpfG family c-di-GMP phosphodiesterase
MGLGQFLMSDLVQHGDAIRVLLVDDHAMVRQGLRSLLQSYSNLEVVGEAANGEEAVTLAALLRPAVIVMDINMPKMMELKPQLALLAERLNFPLLDYRCMARNTGMLCFVRVPKPLSRKKRRCSSCTWPSLMR